MSKELSQPITTKAEPNRRNKDFKTARAVPGAMMAQKPLRKKASNAGAASMEQVVNAAALANNQHMTVELVVQKLGEQWDVLSTTEKDACFLYFDTVRNEACGAMHVAKDKAMRAAALAYQFWMLSEVETAKKHIAAKIEARNKAIDKHNAEVEAEKKKRDNFRDGKIVIPETASNAAEAAENDRLRTYYKALDARPEKDWAALRKMRVEAKPDANPFTLIVKFVFGFDKASDASLVSRYATALTVLHDRFKGNAATTEQEMVDHLISLGGFEAAVSKGKSNDSDGAEEASISPEKRKELTKKLFSDAKARAKAQPAQTMFYPLPGHTKEGFVAVLYYYDENGEKMVGDLGIDVDEVIEHVGRHQLRKAGAREPSVTFMRRVVELGEVVGGTVEKGKAAKVGAEKEARGTTKGDVHTDQSVVRKLSMRRDKDGAAQMVVSAKYAAASAIVHATPYADAFAGVEHVTGVCAMEQAAFAKMNRSLHDPMVSYFATLKQGVDPQKSSPFYWDLGNSEVGDSSRLYWSNVTNGAEKALDIEPDFAGRVTLRTILTEDAVKTLYREGAAIWGGSKRPNKKTKEMELAFDKTGKLTLKIEAQPDVEVGTSGNTLLSETVKLRPQDLYRLLKALSEQASNWFLFEVDPSGAMAVFWRDTLGAYAIYQPLMTADKRLSDKRIGKMELVGPSIIERLEAVEGVEPKKSSRRKPSNSKV